MRKVCFALAVLAVAGLAFPTVVLAQDDPNPGSQDAAQAGTASDPETPRKKRFPLYVETSVGSASTDQLDLTVEANATARALTFLDIDKQDYARVAVGWQLPEGKGDFRLTFEGFKETSYGWTSTGQSFRIIDQTNPNTPGLTDGFVDWWVVDITSGQLTSVKSQPTWGAADDANGNSVAEAAEVRLVPIAGGTTRPVPDDLQNRIQVAEFLFQRGWGGRTINASWGAGGRYFVYEGNLPLAAWLRPDFVGTGFTDGTLMRPIVANQDTSGYGPSGFAELHINFFKDRAQLYFQIRAAFLFVDLRLDTGTFIAQAPSSAGSFFANIPAQLIEERSKDVWHTGFELGTRIRLGAGINLHLAAFRNGYLDSVLAPTTILVPNTQQAAGQGVSALYQTKDFIVDTIRGGISIQF